jgi:Leucine-rich repeat (LRR) protein
MLYGEVCSYLEHDTPVSARRTHMMAAMSHFTRRETLNSSGLQFGPVKVFISSEGVSINVCEECSIPPIGWWNIEGPVSVSANCASLTACKLIALLKRSWCQASITRVELSHEDEVGEQVQEKIIHTLGILRDDLIDLRLGNFYLSDEGEVPDFTHLRTLLLTDFSGPIQKWSPTLNNSVERVEICDTVAFTSSSFAHLEDNIWYRLILDNTNITTSNLKQLRCTHTLKTLSLIDCRRIDSFDAAMFPELRLLLLGRTPISSDWLTGIETCRHLHLINLGGCRAITDINVLGQLKEIREIFAHETNVTNSGIAGLAACENLEKLNLGGCRNISNVNHLGCLTALKELHLWSTKVSNSGIRDLSCCSSLTELVLDDCTHITDVSSLGHLPSLRWLSLIGTEVDGHGIKELLHCRSLETLALAGTRIDKPPKLWRHATIIEFLSTFR